MINVSPDNLPLDIECGPDSLVDVIRAVLTCQNHVECAQSPLRININADELIPNGSINPTPTPFNSFWHAHQDNAAVGSARACNRPECAPVGYGITQYANPITNVVTDRYAEQRLDWVTDRLNEWYGSIDQVIIDSALNSLILKVNEMVASGTWSPDRPQPLTISPGWNRYEIAEKQLTEMGWVFDAPSKAWVKPIDPTEQLAQEYEKRDILDNASAVRYMRERIQQLEAEKNQLAQMHNQASGERDRFRALNSNQKADIDKWFDMMDKWGWKDGEPHEWLQVFVETLVQNAQKATADANELGNRLNMRNGELQAAIDLKNELFTENRRANEDLTARQEVIERLQASAARRDHELYSVADSNKKLEAKLKRLQSKLKAAGL